MIYAMQTSIEGFAIWVCKCFGLNVFLLINICQLTDLALLQTVSGTLFPHQR